MRTDLRDRNESEDWSDDGAGADKAPGSGRMQALLASYYGIQGGEKQTTVHDIDSAVFDSEAFVRSLLYDGKVESLLKRDNQMVQEVKKLDSDMQMLVYENYNKFISATDTIRKMKQNVESMEAEMGALVRNMDKISDSSAKINGRLAGKRERIDKLVRVRRLLKRLEFLFELPQKLQEAVELGQFGKAIRYFTMTKDILKKHSSVTSFAAILHESEDRMRAIRDALSVKVRDPAVKEANLLEYVPYLLELGVPRPWTRDRFLGFYSTRFTEFFAESAAALVDDGSVSLESCVGQLSKGFLPMLLRAVTVYERLFLQPQALQQVPQLPPLAAVASPPRSLAGASQPPPAKGAPGSSSAGAQKGSGSASPPAGSSNAQQPAEEDYLGPLKELMRVNVDRFFGHLDRKVDLVMASAALAAAAAAAAPPPPAASAAEAAEAAAADADARLHGVVATLQQLVADVEMVHEQIPAAGLPARASQFVRAVKMKQALHAFRGLCASATENVASLAATVEGDSQLTQAEGLRSSYRRQTGYQALLEAAVGEVLRETEKALVATKQLATPDGAYGGAAATEEALAVVEHLHRCVWWFGIWLCETLQKLAGVPGSAADLTLPSADDDDHDIDAEAEDSSDLPADGAAGARADRAAYALVSYDPAALASVASSPAQAATLALAGSSGGSGRSVLLFACLAREVGNSFVPKAAELLSRHVPLPPALDSPSLVAAAEAPEPMRRLAQRSASRTLSRYVEVTGCRLAKVARDSFEASDGQQVPEPTQVGLDIMQILEGVERAAAEASAFLGEARVNPVAMGRAGAGGGGAGAYRRASAATGAGSGGGSGAGAQRNLQLDVDRLFASEVSVFGGVRFTCDSIVGGVLRVVLKAMAECCRMCTLAGGAFRQSQADIDFLHQVLPIYVTDGAAQSRLASMLDQVVIAAEARALDPEPLQQRLLTDIVSQALAGFG